MAFIVYAVLPTCAFLLKSPSYIYIQLNGPRARACARACVRACARACVCVCARACVLYFRLPSDGIDTEELGANLLIGEM